MINRILIRIKVVQMLYSYLLTRNEFKVAQEPAEANTSNDKRFGYAAYLDLLMLMLEVSGVATVPGRKASDVVVDKKLAKASLARALMSNPDMQAVVFKNKTDIDVLRRVAQHLHDEMVASSVYATFSRKRSTDLSDEVKMWETVIQSIFAKDGLLDAAMRELPGYSSVGKAMAVDMLVDTLRSYYGVSAGYVNALKALEVSLDKAYELYIGMFALMIEITREASRRIETARSKHLATSDELNPNMRFVDNRFIARLAESDVLEKACHDHAISWETDIALVNGLLDRIQASKIYEDYMNASTSDYAADCEVWRSIMKNIVFPSDDLAEALEDKSVYWNDDLAIMGTFVIKTIKQCAVAPDVPFSLLPQYKDEEDAKFGAELFVDAVKHREEYRGYVDKFINTGSWDPERLAFMDIVIMITAISELLNYPNIPLAVTMNEYVDIANAYSTAKSGQFVNGILYNVANMLRNEGRLMK